MNLTFLAAGVGVLGLICFAASFLLAIRIPRFDQVFGGLPTQFKVHHVVGILSLVFTLAHIFFEFASFGKDGFLLLFELSESGNLSGWIAFFGLTGVVALAIGGPKNHRHWRIIHFSSIAFFLAACWHAWVMQNTWPGVVVFAGILGMLGILASHVFHNTPFWGNKYRIETRSVGRTSRFVLAPKNSNYRLKFLPGQFVFVRFLRKGLSRQWHPFSLASSPADQKLEIIVKALGKDTSHLDLLEVGDEVDVEGPFGFWRRSTDARQLWIAGGVGIVPFVSLKRTELKQHVHLIYCVNSPTDIVHPELWQTNECFMSTFLVASKGELIDRNLIKDALHKLGDCEVYLCGPPAFMKVVKMILKEVAFPMNKLFSEDFKLW